MEMYSPQPKFEPQVLPRQIPKAVVPSYVGDEGIVADWLFYLGSGDTLYDFSGKDNHGALHGPKWTDGPHGWGLHMNGSSDYVEVADDASLHQTESFSVGAWFLLDTAGQDYPGIACKWGAGTPPNAWLWFGCYWDGADYYIRSNMADGSSTDVLEDTTTPLSLDAFYMGFQTYDGTTRKLFVNGSVVASDTPISPGSNTNFLAIGQDAQGSATTFFPGTVAWVLIYNHALSDSRVDRMFEDTRAIFGV